MTEEQYNYYYKLLCLKEFDEKIEEEAFAKMYDLIRKEISKTKEGKALEALLETYSTVITNRNLNKEKFLKTIKYSKFLETYKEEIAVLQEYLPKALFKYDEAHFNLETLKLLKEGNLKFNND